MTEITKSTIPLTPITPIPPSKLFKKALQDENPLQIVGVINALSALLAKEAQFKALYLSGAGVANASFGLPDLGVTSLNDVLEEVRRIRSAVSLPLLVDGDTGFGSCLNIERTVQELIRAGASGVHLEDQAFPKRCGHRGGKRLISTEEMVERLKTAVKARENTIDPDFIIMARTDAISVEGVDSALERLKAYVKTGVDMVFVEAVQDIQDYQKFTQALKVPVLANMTEFGKTPITPIEDLKKMGVQMVLYPLSAFRAMNKAAMQVYEAIRKEGSQASVISSMQTREELYQLLNYYELEKRLEGNLSHE